MHTSMTDCETKISLSDGFIMNRHTPSPLLIPGLDCNLYHSLNSLALSCHLNSTPLTTIRGFSAQDVQSGLHDVPFLWKQNFNKKDVEFDLKFDPREKTALLPHSKLPSTARSMKRGVRLIWHFEQK